VLAIRQLGYSCRKKTTSMRITGTVREFVDGRGNIRGEDGHIYYVTASNVEAGDRTLFPDEQVEFISGPLVFGRDQQHALNVRRPYGRPGPRPLRENPFSPQVPISEPARFAGRRDELRTSLEALHSRQNVIVSGERGAGKSSLCQQLVYALQGETELLARAGLSAEGVDNRHVLAVHNCTPSDTLENVIEGLTLSLERQLGVEERQTKRTVRQEFNLYRYKIERAREFTNPPRDRWSLVQFVATLIGAFKNPRDMNGITIFVDEIDTLSIDKEVARQSAHFFKAVSENLRAHGITAVSIVVAGVSGTVTELMKSNPSFSRTFQSVEIGRMSNADSKEVIDRALESSSTTVRMSADARAYIAELSAGLPSTIQLLGYHAFAVDQDDYIDLKDVNRAVADICHKVKGGEYQGLLDWCHDTPDIVRTLICAAHMSEPFELRDLAVCAGTPVDLVRRLVAQELSSQSIAAKPVFSSCHGLLQFADPLFRHFCAGRLSRA
jgi:hypothetical protein